MEQSKKVGASKPAVAGRTPGKKKTPHKHTQEIRQNNGFQLDGLDKYFQVLPLVENYLNETDPQLKKGNGIFFTPYPVVSFIVRSIHEILKEKLGKPLGLAEDSVKTLDPVAEIATYFEDCEHTLPILRKSSRLFLDWFLVSILSTPFRIFFDTSGF
jgi:hypothetical protein